MNPQIWIMLSFTLIFFLIYLSARKTRQEFSKRSSIDIDDLPKTKLQKMTLLTFILVVAFTIAAFGMVSHYGVEVWWQDDSVRAVVTFLLLSPVLIFFVFNLLVEKLKKRDDGTLDERDEYILSRACSGVGGAMIVVLAGWMLGLTETYRETHLVPTYYLYLMFWSGLITNLLASLGSILMAYRSQ